MTDNKEDPIYYPKNLDYLNDQKEIELFDNYGNPLRKGDLVYNPFWSMRERYEIKSTTFEHIFLDEHHCFYPRDVYLASFIDSQTDCSLHLLLNQTMEVYYYSPMVKFLLDKIYDQPYELCLKVANYLKNSNKDIWFEGIGVDRSILDVVKKEEHRVLLKLLFKDKL